MSNEEQLRRISMAYEKKLIELMGAEAFREFSTEIAREMFADEICAMPESDFKESILENFDAITGSDEDYQKLMGNIRADHVEAHCMPAGNCFECKHAIEINEKFVVCDLINEGSHKCKFEKREADDEN